MAANVNTLRDFQRVRRKAMGKIQWGAVRALTRVAQESQSEIQKVIPQKFDTTKKWWLKSSPTGIKIKIAKKSTMVSEVFTGPKNTWLRRHDAGERRRPIEDKLIIPVYRKSGSSPNKADKKFAGFKPQTWRKAKGRTTALKKYGRKNRAIKRGYPIVIQTAKGNTLIKKGKGQSFQLVFTEKRSTKRMTKRISMFKITKRTVKREFNRLFREEIVKAFGRV